MKTDTDAMRVAATNLNLPRSSENQIEAANEIDRLREENWKLRQPCNCVYGNHEAWEREWLAGNTEWWPDTIDLPGDAEQVIRAGCPSSPIPRKAQDRIQKLREAGEIYVTYVASGVHAYRIGRVSEYLPNVRMSDGL